MKKNFYYAFILLIAMLFTVVSVKSQSPNGCIQYRVNSYSLACSVMGQYSNNIGIGTTSPLAKLNVVSTGTTMPFEVDSLNKKLFKILRGGQIFAQTADTSSNNLFIGKNSGFKISYNHSGGHEAASALNNTAIGINAMQFLTTGGENVAIGANSMDSMTTGSANIAIGQYSMSRGKNIHLSVGVGEDALGNDTASSYNTAIGAHAISSHIAGDNNTSVGFNNLQNDISSHNNTSVGALAMQSNTVSDNDAFGFSALNANITGSNNSVFGENGLGRITGGNFNTALGSNAGALAKGTSIGNTLVGYAAGYGDNSNAYSHNTIVGASAGQGITTGSDNIIIGYQSNATQWGSLNSTLWIDEGNNAIPIIYGNLSTQQLGFGTTSPNSSAKVEITSTTQGFRITPMTSTQASAITPAEGLILFVSDTNGTFTSIGLWDYENGAWHKM